MKADCLAIVDSNNETLWVRSATYSPELAATALAEMRRESPSCVLALIKSYVDTHGNEQFVELMTPWADAYLKALADGQPVPGKAVVEVWLDNEPMFGFGGIADALDSDKFNKCAAVLVPHNAGDDEVTLDRCYCESQNIDSNWKPGKGCRSSSVGDVFVIKTPEGQQAYAVSSFGFKKVQFSETEFPGRLSPYRAEAYLRRLGANENIGDLYDEDDMLQSALITLIPNFEYPNWSYRTIGEVLKTVLKK